MNKTLITYIIGLTLLFTGLNLSSQNLNTPIPVDPQVLTGTFSNGLKYYVRQNAKPEQKVELRLVVKVGSIVEDNDQLGLAHFMEHMNFNGTKNFEKNELVNYLQSIGVEFGADLNAYTAFDQTVYILPIPTDKPGNLDKGFQIIEDWAHNALLTDSEIDSERGVVLEESRLGKGAEQRMLDKYLPRLVAGSKYAERLPIGKDHILKNFQYETLRRFYRDWYRPDLQAVIVVGDIDTASAMQYLRKHFASLPKAQNPRPRIYEKITSQNKSEAMVTTDKEATSARLMLLFPYSQQKEMKTIGDYREMLKRNLVLDMLNKRLSDLARGADSPFPMAYMGFNDLIRGAENFVCVTIFGEQGPEKALNAMTAELLRARKFGFTQDELEMSIKDLIKETEKKYNERNTTESNIWVEEYIRNFLNNEPIPGIETEHQWTMKLLSQISLNETNQLIKTLSGKDYIFSLITAPDKEDVKLPTEKELQKMVAKAFKQDVKPIQREKIAEQLNVPLNPPGEIILTQIDTVLKTVTYTLDNAIKVSVKTTNFKEDEVLLSGIKKGGYNNYDAKDRNDVHFTTEIVKAMGVGTYSPSDLEKILSGKNVSVSTHISEIENSVSASSTVKDLEVMFQLLNLYLTAPRKDSALAETYKSSQKMIYTFAAASPEYAFFDTTFKKLYNNNPLFVSPIPKPADFDRININHILSIYKKEFGSPEGYHFFIAGNVDTNHIKSLITKYLGSIFRSEEFPTYKDDGLRPISGDQKFIFRKGSEKKSMIGGFYHGEVPFSEDLSLHIRMASEILNIKVTEELREKLGAIYSGQISANLERDPYAHYETVIILPCGPENVDTLLHALNAEINKLIVSGPEDKDFEKVKTQLLEQHRTHVQENKYWLGKMETILGKGYNKGYLINFNDWVEHVSKKDVQEAAKIIFNDQNRFISILYPAQ